MITIIDLGIGNIKSVSSALNYLRIPNRISNNIKDIKSAKKLILPGVGNFSEASRRMHSMGLKEVIREQVVGRKKPILGICLGMQLLAKEGEEGGFAKGLELVDARVSKLRSETEGCHLPHIGWNDISGKNMALFSGIEDNSCFYFVHSYEVILEEKIEYAIANYGVDFVAVFKKDNIVGVQFHPEKSQQPGLQLLKNFVEGVI